jgi:PAS domain S-box-containing protein
VVVGCVQARAKGERRGAALTLRKQRSPGLPPVTSPNHHGDVNLIALCSPLADNFLIMVTELDRDPRLEQALAGGAPERVGWFRLYFDGEQWEWSPEVERLHGYEPGTVKPTTALVLSHKHPEDYEQVAATLQEIRRTHRPFSTRHRIIDVQGHTHEVVVVADLFRDHAGQVIGTYGFYVDVTGSAEDRESSITEAVAEFAAHRAVIEQVKGILMVVYSITADAAFDLLKWRSQETNVKLRTLAEQLLADFLTLIADKAVPSQATFDQLLLTAHERITDRTVTD